MVGFKEWCGGGDYLFGVVYVCVDEFFFLEEVFVGKLSLEILLSFF